MRGPEERRKKRIENLKEHFKNSLENWSQIDEERLKDAYKITGMQYIDERLRQYTEEKLNELQAELEKKQEELQEELKRVTGELEAINYVIIEMNERDKRRRGQKEEEEKE